jgi:hypothetical protein
VAALHLRVNDTAQSWGDGLAAKLFERNTERYERERRDGIRWSATADLLTWAEVLDLERATVAVDYQDGKLSGDDYTVTEHTLLGELTPIVAELERRSTLSRRGVDWLRSPALFDAAYIRDLRARVDLPSFIVSNFTGTELRRVGDGYRGKCLFHADGPHGAFSVHDERWRCWSCGEGGDVFSFVMKMGSSFGEAVRMVAGWAHVPLAERGR